MGLLGTIASALGLRTAPKAVEAGPFALGESARVAALAMADGEVLHVMTRPAETGRVVHVFAGPPRAEPRELDDVPIVVSDGDLGRLFGLRLEHRDGRFLVALELSVVGQETPNPDSRLYTASRRLHRGRPQFYAAGDADLPPLARTLLALPGVRHVLFRDFTVAIGREEAYPWRRLDAAVDAALREHLLGCGEPVDTHRHAEQGGALADAVQRVLIEEVLPGVHADGGHIELVDVRDGVVRVHMEGACKSCPAATATLQAGVHAALQRALGDRVVRVEQV
jgi:Fe-S cluster biogenesis protein NfuA